MRPIFSLVSINYDDKTHFVDATTYSVSHKYKYLFSFELAPPIGLGKGVGNLRLVIPRILGNPGNHIKSKVRFKI